MAGIDDVLERVLTDTDFARRLAHDPASALAGYELTADDLTLLSTQVSFDPGALSLVEERVSKAGLFGMLSTFTAGLGSIIGPDTPTGGAAIGPEYTPTGRAALDPGDMSDPTEPAAQEPDVGDSQGLEPGAQEPDGGDHGTGGGAGSEVYFKEVEPGMEPDGPDHGTGGGAGSEVSFLETTPDTPDHGTGGGAGSEVSIKEVDPADPPDPDRPGESQGLVLEGGVDTGHPDLMHGTGGGAGLPSPGDTQGFNPQPDPPGVTLPSDDAISPIAQGG